MRNYYKDIANSRNFIRKITYKKDKSGNAIILVYTGSGEHFSLDDTPINRTKVKKYERQMRVQVMEGTNHIEKIVDSIDLTYKKINKISSWFTLGSISMLFVSLIILILLSFNLGSIFAIISSSVFVGTWISNPIVKLVYKIKSSNLINDIIKNEEFLEIEQLLKVSLHKNDGKALEGIKTKSKKIIEKSFKTQNLNVGNIEKIPLNDIHQISDNLTTHRIKSSKKKESEKIIQLFQKK